MTCLLTDKDYDVHVWRKALRQTGPGPVLSSRYNQKCEIRYDKIRDKDRHCIENAFCRIKDTGHLETRSDQRARPFLSARTLAVLRRYWL